MQLKLPTISPHILRENHIDELSNLLTGMQFGLEKEGLRVDRTTGQLAQTPHPRDLGSALTHSHITTDYSEALLEFVTGTHASPHAAIQELEELHILKLCAERRRIWPLSMPCQLPESDSDIPLAYYGSPTLAG